MIQEKLSAKGPLLALAMAPLVPFILVPFVVACVGAAEAGSADVGGGAETAVTVAPSTNLPKPTFTADGRIGLPKRYREWVYVGAPLTPNSLNPPEAPFPEFHSVYIHPDDFAHYGRTGEFPQGTMIVKELVTVGSEQATSGNGFFMGEFAGLEITIKDAERFPEEPGNWAYFSYGHSLPYAASAEIMPTASCNACHAAAAAEDFVFTQYYPVLRDAKGPSAQ